MKQHIKKMGVLTLLAFTACKTNNNEEKELVQDSVQYSKPAAKFENIVFASKKDTTCGMPVTAGVEDTLVLNGKIYGFCSVECKDEFLTQLKQQHKR